MSALRICALIAVVLDLQLVAAGKVGCRYDDLLCGSAEVCVDDSLFGVCILAEYAEDGRVAELNHAIIERLAEDESRARELRLLLTFLGRAGYTWREPFTQCVVDAFRVSVITQADASDYDRCLGVQELADGQLTSPINFRLDDIDDAYSSSEALEAEKRDEEVVVHKYFKKKDSGARRDALEARVDDLLSLSNDELRSRIQQLRLQVATALYQDEARRAGLQADDDDDDQDQSDSDSDEQANRARVNALLRRLVQRMKERVRLQLEELDSDSDSGSAADMDDNSSEQQSTEDQDSQETLTRESAMLSAPLKADISVDKKQDGAAVLPPATASSLAADDSDDVNERYGVIEITDHFSSRESAADAFAKLVKATNWPESRCLVFLGLAESSNVLRFGVDNQGDCKFFTAEPFLHKLWNDRESLKTATQYDVQLVALGKENLRVLDAAQRANDAENSELLVTVIVCGVVLCVVLIAVICFIVCTMVRRRRRQSELDKSLLLGGSDAPETYGELCRQRMTASANEKLEAIPVPVRSLFGRSKIFARSSPPPSKTSPDRSQINSTSSSNAWMDEPLQTNMDITTGHAILSYMEAFMRNPEKLELEWQGLSEYEADRKATSVAQREENLLKNRFAALLPYDHNRVVLTNYLGGDYVNASFIADHDPRSPAYIATQSPMAETANDFWQMVWEHGGNILVDLVSSPARSADGNNNAGANETEYRYWPSEGMETFGSLELHLVSEHLVCNDYVVRNFYLKNTVTNETRTITQFHFVSWNEHSVPSMHALLEFRRKVIKSHHHGKSKPIVVHCSDGCGRTGTYCLIDLVLNRIAKGTVKEVDVGATIEHLRDQRVSMVKTKKQFEFALMSIAEEVNAVLKALAAQQTKQ